MMPNATGETLVSPVFFFLDSVFAIFVRCPWRSFLIACLD